MVVGLDISVGNVTTSKIVGAEEGLLSRILNGKWWKDM